MYALINQYRPQGPEKACGYVYSVHATRVNAEGAAARAQCRAQITHLRVPLAIAVLQRGRHVGDWVMPQDVTIVATFDTEGA